MGLGHNFSSESDSEVIVHSYEEGEIDFLDRLEGMYALALYDKQKDRWILARDRVGQKPLYIYQKNNIFAFASELKAFIPIPEFEKKLILRRWTHILSLGMLR